MGVRQLYVADIGPAPVDLRGIRAGDRNLMRIEIFSENDPMDLTGATVEAQSRMTPRDTTVAVQAVVTPFEPELGSFDIEWPGEDVRDLLDSLNKDSVSIYWDVQVTDFGSTEPVTVAAGRWHATYDVTRT